MLNNRIVIIVSTLACFQIIACSSYRILGIFPAAARSHYFLGSSLLKGLAEAGHDITIITPFEEQNPPKNGSWREIFLSDHESFTRGVQKQMNISARLTNMNPFAMMALLKDMTVTLTELTINNTEVQKLIASNEKFDAVIVTDFLVDALKAFAHKFNAHLITYSNHGALNWYHHDYGQFVPPSAFPEILLSYPANMTFFQRTVNTFAHLVTKAFINYIILPDQQNLVEKYLPGSPPLSDILQNVSLAIVNSHISLNFPFPKIPLIIEVGGLHITPAKKLPTDLQKLLDNAKEGVIYFSMGSHIKSDDLPANTIDVLLKTFAKRKELILWKWGQDTLYGKPENVYIGKWFPQQDILAHPNVKLFITHSGFLSTTETIYHGVPVVSIPVGGDQKLNAKAAAQEGYGVSVFLDNFNEELLGGAIEEVISNPKYLETIKEKSKLFRDRPRPPIEDAVYWVEYVIRHNGAKHLRVPYRELRWYQYYLLDVFGFVTITLLTSLYILKKVFGFLIRKCLKLIKGPKVKMS